MRTVRCSGRRIPACTGQGGVSQHALGSRVCVSQHALGRGDVDPSMHWARVVSARVVSAWGCLPVSLPKGVSVGWVSAQGVSEWGCLPHTPPHGQNDRRL